MCGFHLLHVRLSDSASHTSRGFKLSIHAVGGSHAVPLTAGGGTISQDNSRDGDAAPRVMEGVRVLEVAAWTYVPSAGAVLAEWGADVIKIEHPEMGDPQRGLVTSGLVQ